MVLHDAMRNVARSPRRAVTIVIAVAMGVASLIFLTAFNSGALDRLREVTIHARHGHGQVALKGFFGQTLDKPYEHWIPGGRSVEGELRAVPGVKETFPRVSFPALLTNGDISVSGLGQGIDGVREGAFFTALNVEEGRTLGGEPDGVLLGQGLARALDAKVGGAVTVLGSTVNGTTNSMELVVTGIFHTGNPEFDDRIFRLPLAAAQTFLDTDRVETIALALADDRDDAWSATARAIATALPQLEARSYAELDEVYFVHTRDWLASQAGVFQMIVALLVFFGVLNTVSSGVMERRQEIGNLRANGESRLDVLSLFALEATIMALIGATIGLVLSLLLAYAVLSRGILLPPPAGQTRALLVMLHPAPAAMLAVSVAAVIVTVAAAIVACARAVRIPITEALRAT